MSSSCCRIIEPEALKQGNMSSLGFTSKEQRNLGLLVHLMTTNPKILYSPLGSQVDKVIQKVSRSTVFVTCHSCCTTFLLPEKLIRALDENYSICTNSLQLFKEYCLILSRTI